MILGIMLGTALSIFIVSASFLLYSIFTTGLASGTYTGAIIGSYGITSYSLITTVLSLIAIFIIYLMFKNKNKKVYFPE